MKKLYTNPELNVTSFEAADIITASVVLPADPSGDNLQTQFDKKKFNDIEF